MHRVKQSYLIERNSINVDSLNQKWQLKLRMDGICANTGIKLTNSLKNGERISASSGLNEPDCFLLAYSTGVGYGIKMDAFIRPFWATVVLKAHWNNIWTWNYVLFSLIFCLFYVPGVRLFLVQVLSKFRIVDNHVKSSQPLVNKKVNLFGRSMDLHLIICRGVSLIIIRLVYSENKLLRYCWHFLKYPAICC